jgi:hypothetical protein
MLCQCWSYFFHWTNIDKMSNILVLYQCHFKTCYNVTLTSYQWLYQHWTFNILLRCCKSTHTKRGQVCDGPMVPLTLDPTKQVHFWPFRALCKSERQVPYIGKNKGTNWLERREKLIFTNRPKHPHTSPCAPKGKSLYLLASPV